MEEEDEAVGVEKFVRNTRGSKRRKSVRMELTDIENQSTRNNTCDKDSDYYPKTPKKKKIKSKGFGKNRNGRGNYRIATLEQKERAINLVISSHTETKISIVLTIGKD